MKHKTYRLDPYKQFIKTPTQIKDDEQLEYFLRNIFLTAAGITYVTFEVVVGNKYTAPSIKVLEDLMKTYPTIDYKLIKKK